MAADNVPVRSTSAKDPGRVKRRNTPLRREKVSVEKGQKKTKRQICPTKEESE